MLVRAALIVLFTAGCGPTLTCRAPDITSFTAEGVPDAVCDVSFSRCEDGSNVDISCSNETFSGDYDCTWTRFGVRPGDFQSGTFSSPDLCTADTDTITEELERHTGVRIEVE
jgi:hypothetical protein